MEPRVGGKNVRGSRRYHTDRGFSPNMRPSGEHRGGHTPRALRFRERVLYRERPRGDCVASAKQQARYVSRVFQTRPALFQALVENTTFRNVYCRTSNYYTRHIRTVCHTGYLVPLGTDTFLKNNQSRPGFDSGPGRAPRRRHRANSQR